MTPVLPSWRPLSESDQLLQAAYGDVQIMYWRGAVTIDDLQATRSAFRELWAAYPAGFGALNIIKHDLPVPDDACRTLAADIAKESGAAVRATAMVVPGVGFWPAAARGVLTVIHRLQPVPFPRQIFGERDPAVSWVSGQIGRSSDFADALSAALDRRIAG